MKNLSELLEESKNEILFEADEQQGDDQGQDQKNKPVKGDAGKFKVWKAVSCTMRGWLKTMSGQEEVKASFFDNGFLVPTTVQAILAGTNANVATLQKNLDTQIKCTITEFTDDFSFTLDGGKFGYTSTGWKSNSGGGISTIIKNLTANSKQQEQKQDNKQDDGNSNSGTM